jgi:predicted ArsR family transcriptional regulator
MKLTSRLRILEIIRKHQAISVKEISLLTGYTGANVRHHLAMLENNQLVEVIGTKAEKRGRPWQVYALSRRLFGDGLDALVNGLFGILYKNANEEQQNSILNELALYMVGQSRNEEMPSVSQIKKTIEWMNALHYQARWEAGATGPVIILDHCPYYPVIDQNPDLCKLDLKILEKTLRAPISHISKLQPSNKDLPACTFQVVNLGAFPGENIA